jgi:hypothetical protein
MKSVICLFFVLLSFSVYSQSDTTLTFNTSLGGNVTGGNFISYGGNIKSELVKDWKKSQINWNPSFEYSKISTNGTLHLREREIYSSLNFNKKFNSFNFYLFNEMEHSFLQKVDLRSSLGVGLGHKIVKNKNWDINISEMIMPEFMMSSFGNLYDNFSIRSSTRLKIKWSNSIYKFNSVSFFQPALYTVKSSNGDLVNIPFNDNLNFRSNTTIEAKVSKVISLGVGNSLTYEAYSHSINKEVKPLDYNFYFFLKIN